MLDKREGGRAVDMLELLEPELVVVLRRVAVDGHVERHRKRLQWAAEGTEQRGAGWRVVEHIVGVGAELGVGHKGWCEVV